MKDQKKAIEQAPIESLSHDPANVRRHPERNIEAIKASLRRFGQQKPIVVDSNGVVIAGNGTLEAARALGWKTIDVVRSDLSGSDRTAFAIADNRSAELAEWDIDGLKSQLAALESEGFPVAEFRFDDLPEIEADLDVSESGDGEENIYTKAMRPPIYEPNGRMPRVSDLFDRSVTEKLLNEIDSSDVPPDVADFLRIAAERHTVIRFGRVAEWYCHLPPNLQRLVENQALVIIDYKAAIERGYVKTVSDLMEIADGDVNQNEDE